MTPAAARGRGALLGRLLPLGPAGMRRTPFVLLVVFLLGSGLIALLLLNSSLNQGSFELTKLQRKTTELTDEQQALQQEVDQLAAPDALERRARELGLVPGGSPAFLGPDGTVHGVPAPAPPAGGTPETDPAAYVPGAVRPGGTPPGTPPNPAVVPDRAAAPNAPGVQGVPGGARPPAAPPVPDPAYQPYQLPAATEPNGQNPPAGRPQRPSPATNGQAPALPPYPQPPRPAGPAGTPPQTPTVPGSPGR
ncbi:FtsB family cell division protein [Streptomyces luteireticuli]|uniref:Septum formation initiator family protein n=1 Tax=Streptomyces luteireticuli TaxID=173858 RepID=A0ABN0YS72_9ACTN